MESQTVKWKTNYLTVRVLLTLHKFLLFLILNYIRISPFSDTDTRLIYFQLTNLIEVGFPDKHCFCKVQKKQQWRTLVNNSYNEIIACIK